MSGILCQRLFHKCMKIVLEPTCLNAQQYHTIPGPDGLLQLTMTIMMAWIANLEEQIMIVGVSNRSCPVCLTAHKNFNSWNGPISHTPHLPEATISELCL